MSDLRKKYGELLKLERERKGIKLEDLAEQLKISLTHLESLESGDIRSLPSELYYGLFVKSYSEALGIDYVATMDAMRAELEESSETKEAVSSATPAKKKARPEKAPEAGPEETEQDDSSGILKWLLYGLGGLAVLFVAFLLVNYFFLSNKSATSDQTSTEQQQANSGATVPTQKDIDAEVASFNWKDTVGYEMPQKLTLSLTAIDQSWSTIVADGDTALFRNLIPGRQYDIEADFRMLVSIGIPSLVKVRLNGQPVDLVDPLTGRISRVEITQANLHKFLSPEEATKQSSTREENTPTEQETNQAPVQPLIDTASRGGTGDEH